MQPGHRLSSASPSARIGRAIGLSRDATLSLLIHGCFQFGASMSGLFLNLYLWRLTESLWINGMFNIIVYAVTPAAFALGGWIAKKLDRMVTYRLGIGLIALFYLLVVVARESVVDWYMLFALFNGTALGLYWVGYLVLMYDVAEAKDRARYLGVNMIVFNAAGLAGPALAGYLIGLFKGLQGYIVMFACACFMFMMSALFSTRIGRRDMRKRGYYLPYAGQMMRRQRSWLFALFAFLALGLFQGIMLFLPNILLYQAAGGEAEVGLLTVLLSLLTIAMGFIFSKRKRTEGVRRDVAVSAGLITLSACPLLVDIELWSVLVFMGIFSLFNPLILNTLNVYYFKVMDGLPLRGHFRIESVVTRELFLNAGRVLSIFGLIALVSDPHAAAMPVVLVCASLLQLLIVPLVRKTETA